MSNKTVWLAAALLVSMALFIRILDYKRPSVAVEEITEATLADEFHLNTAPLGFADESNRMSDSHEKREETAHRSGRFVTTCVRVGDVADNVGVMSTKCETVDLNPNPLAGSLDQLLQMEATGQPIPVQGMEVLANHYLSVDEPEKGYAWLKEHSLHTGDTELLQRSRLRFSPIGYPLLEYEVHAMLVRARVSADFTEDQLSFTREIILNGATTEDEKEQLLLKLLEIDGEVDDFVSAFSNRR